MTSREALNVIQSRRCDNFCIFDCEMCDIAYEEIKSIVNKEEKYRWHNSNEAVPTIGLPVIIMRIFENIRTGEKHKEYDAGHLNEYWEILTNDCDYVCDYDDVDAWKYIEEHEG